MVGLRGIHAAISPPIGRVRRDATVLILDFVQGRCDQGQRFIMAGRSRGGGEPGEEKAETGGLR